MHQLTVRWLGIQPSKKPAQRSNAGRAHSQKKATTLNNKRRTATPAIPEGQESLTHLRDVSHMYDIVTELLGDIRRDAVVKAQAEGHTIRAIGAAMGRHHATVLNIAKKPAA
jgi:hypothetical protein